MFPKKPSHPVLGSCFMLPLHEAQASCEAELREAISSKEPCGSISMACPVGGFNLPLVGNMLLIMVNINGYYMVNDG